MYSFSHHKILKNANGHEVLLYLDQPIEEISNELGS
jgi:hypothetical protein